jgi:hypothetical protein
MLLSPHPGRLSKAARTEEEQVDRGQAFNRLDAFLDAAIDLANQREPQSGPAALY